MAFIAAILFVRSLVKILVTVTVIAGTIVCGRWIVARFTSATTDTFKSTASAMAPKSPETHSAATGIGTNQKLAATVSARGSPASTNIVANDASRPDERTRLLAAVDSRETALVYVDYILSRTTADNLPAEERPKIKILTVDDVPEDQKASFAAAYAAAKAKNSRYVMSRIAGADGIHIFNIPEPQVERLLPAKVIGYLTADDITQFCDRIVYMVVETRLVKLSRHNSATP